MTTITIILFVIITISVQILHRETRIGRETKRVRGNNERQRERIVRNEDKERKQWPINR